MRSAARSRSRFARIGASGRGWAYLPAEEALAGVVVELAERPLVVSNVDFSGQRVGGLASDVVAGFLEELALAAGLNVHVRLARGHGHRARARGDLQGARRRARTGVPTRVRR